MSRAILTELVDASFVQVVLQSTRAVLLGGISSWPGYSNVIRPLCYPPNRFTATSLATTITTVQPYHHRIPTASTRIAARTAALPAVPLDDATRSFAM